MITLKTCYNLASVFTEQETALRIPGGGGGKGEKKLKEVCLNHI